MSFRVGDVVVEFIEKPSVKKGILIQGLLGVGQVGLMAGRQIIDSLGAKKIAHMYSESFLYPGVALPGIVYEENNLVDLHRNEIFFNQEKEIFILSGIYQGTSPESYYRIAQGIIDFCREMNIKEIYTLGGYGVGRKVEEPKVFGVVHTPERMKELEDKGIEILKAPPGTLGATGLAGLLIPLGEKNGIRSICLLAETHGSYPDPKAAKASVLTVSKLLGFEISTKELDEQIDAMEREFAKMEEYARKMTEMYKPHAKDETLPYIG